MITVNIKHWTGETFSVEIDPTEYIDDLKEKIEELHDIPVDQQRMTLNGEEIDDTETVQENNIVDQSTLVLEAMKITVLLPPDGKKKIRLTLKPDDNVKRIKRAVAKKIGNPKASPAALQRLIDSLCVLFDNNELKDGEKMSDCNIDHNDVVIVEKFAITVAHWSGDLISITTVAPHDSTEAIKDILFESHQIPKEDQKFKFGGTIINDFLSLKDQQIRHKAVLQMEKPFVKKEKKKFQLSVFPTETPGEEKKKTISISVQHWNGSTFTIENVNPTEYIEEFKERIQETHKIPVDQQRLLFNGEPVDDTETLEEQNIGDQALLTLEAMRILVVLPDGKKKLRFVVTPDDNIKRIKRLVNKKSTIPADRQIVMFNGKDLKDTQTLAECGVDHGDELDIESFAIVVHHWDGQMFDITEIGPNETGDDVKRLLIEKYDVPNEQLKLLFDGNPVNDFLSLKDQKISHKGVLTLEEPVKEKPKKEKFKLTLFSTEDPATKKANAAASTGAMESVTIQPYKGDPFTVEFSPSEFVEEFKKRIEKTQKIPVKQQVLVIDGTKMEDMEALSEYNITKDSTINMEAMKISVMLPNRKKIRFAVTLDDTIKRLKRIVAKKSSLPADSQCLMLDGVELTDYQKLSECGVDNEDMLTVEQYSISVMHWTGDMFVLTDVKPDDTMEDVRNIILKRKQIPKDMQKFKFEGRVINDFVSLKDQKIKHKSILMMEDLEIIKSPRAKRPSIQEIKYVDTDDEESLFGSSDDEGDAGDDGSESSYIRRMALDENWATS